MFNIKKCITIISILIFSLIFSLPVDAYYNNLFQDPFLLKDIAPVATSPYTPISFNIKSEEPAPSQPTLFSSTSNTALGSSALNTLFGATSSTTKLPFSQGFSFQPTSFTTVAFSVAGIGAVGAAPPAEPTCAGTIIKTIDQESDTVEIKKGTCTGKCPDGTKCEWRSSTNHHGGVREWCGCDGDAEPTTCHSAVYTPGSGEGGGPPEAICAGGCENDEICTMKEEFRGSSEPYGYAIETYAVKCECESGATTSVPSAPVGNINVEPQFGFSPGIGSFSGSKLISSPFSISVGGGSSFQSPMASTFGTLSTLGSNMFAGSFGGLQTTPMTMSTANFGGFSQSLPSFPSIGNISSVQPLSFSPNTNLGAFSLPPSFIPTTGGASLPGNTFVSTTPSSTFIPSIPDPDEKAGESSMAVINSEYIAAPIHIPLDLLNLDMIIHSSDYSILYDLLEAGSWTPFGENPFTVYLGLVPGITDAAQFILQFDFYSDEVNELLDVEGIEPNPTGTYSATEMLFITGDENDNILRFSTICPDTIIDYKNTELGGGCCAVLATAHSLVRKMGGIVKKDDAVERDAQGRETWNPDFLEKVRKASGDTDNSRGLTDGEAEDAHEADWNDSWDVDQEDDDVNLFDNEDKSCDDIKEMCNKLINRLKTNDDITMRIRGKDGKKGEEWGHRVVVESATYSDGPPCKCSITITQTSIQEPGGKADYKDIPFKPGTATYEVSTDENNKTTVKNTEFPDSTISKLSYDSFDEDPKHSGVKPTDQGSPGSALR